MSDQIIDNCVYILGEEIVIANISAGAGLPTAKAFDPATLTAQYPRKIIKYIPKDPLNFVDSWYKQGGTVKMIAGVCKNKDYSIHQFMHKIGNWILLLIVIAALVFIWRI